MLRYKETLHLVGFLLVGEDLHLVDGVGRVSLVHDLLVGEGVSVAARASFVQLSPHEG